MSKKIAFTTGHIDKLVEESIAEADGFKNELEKINPDGSELVFDNNGMDDDYLAENDKTFADKKNIVNPATGDSISYSYIYKKIGDLADTGNASLQLLQSFDPDVEDPSILAAIASLINSIRGCISEYTKIHQKWLNYQQAVKLEEMKQANRKELIKFRHDVSTGEINKVEAGQLFEVGSTDLMEFLQWKKEKEEREKAKDEKI